MMMRYETCVTWGDGVGSGCEYQRYCKCTPKMFSYLADYRSDSCNYTSGLVKNTADMMKHTSRKIFMINVIQHLLAKDGKKTMDFLI